MTRKRWAARHLHAKAAAGRARRTSVRWSKNRYQRTDEDKQRGHTYLVEEDGLGELRSVCVAKIRAAAANDGFFDNPHFMVFLSSWLRWGDKAEVRSWVVKHVDKPRDAVGLLRRLLNKSTSTGAGETKVHHHVHLPFVEQFVDLKRLIDLTTDLKLDDFDGLDKTALVDFHKALKRREEGRPDDDWNARNLLTGLSDGAGRVVQSQPVFRGKNA